VEGRSREESKNLSKVVYRNFSSQCFLTSALKPSKTCRKKGKYILKTDFRTLIGDRLPQGRTENEKMSSLRQTSKSEMGASAGALFQIGDGNRLGRRRSRKVPLDLPWGKGRGGKKAILESAQS